MRIKLPYPPSLNRLYRVVRGRPILSREAREYRAQVQAHLVSIGYEATRSPVAVSVWLYRPRRSGDVDNTLKALLDACNGFLWRDDSQLLELHVYRLDDKESPRVELLIELRT